MFQRFREGVLEAFGRCGIDERAAVTTRTALNVNDKTPPSIKLVDVDGDVEKLLGVSPRKVHPRSFFSRQNFSRSIVNPYKNLLDLSQYAYSPSKLRNIKRLRNSNNEQPLSPSYRHAFRVTGRKMRNHRR